MASTAERLTDVFQNAKRIDFDDESKFILFSDSHRGDNGWADDFAHNQLLFFHALCWYFERGYTYIEVGDGDELWENRDFSVIRHEHKHIFEQMQLFHQKQRLYLIWGNHDIERKDKKIVEEQLFTFYDTRERTKKDLFPGIEVVEGLVLKHSGTGKELFLVHGHQGSFESEYIWPVSRHVVGRFWKPLQVFGFNDPTRPSQNVKKRHEVETKIQDWIRANGNQPLICGHTHRSWFSDPTEDAAYFNTGSCVHPRCITGIEIAGGEIQLIKWWTKVDEIVASSDSNDENVTGGQLRIDKEVLDGPQRLAAYYG
jgi:UDP-2,3-diacylglucosamine pyrophosphatase LpxH